MYVFSEKPALEDLEHFGVKGMKWGVRRERRAQTHVNVGKGEGTRSEKIRSGATIGPVDFVKGRGFQGAAARKGERQQLRNARVKSGESSVRDKIAYYGGSKYQDIFPTGKAATNTAAAVGASVAGAIIVNQALGMVFKAAK
jgi:hypothetical protein